MVSFSFDDGRIDTYTRAYQVMQKYDLIGTLHITTGYIDGSYTPTDWYSAKGGPMTIKQLKLCYQNGFEITSHGDQHITEKQDLLNSISKLNNWGLIDLNELGFSVPHSKCADNMTPTFSACNLKYVRRGRSTACYSFLKKVAYVLSTYTHSTFLFYWFNKPNMIAPMQINPYNLTSTIIKNHNTANQLIYLIKQGEKQKKWNIFMFHSILKPTDLGYGKDPWYFDFTEFEKVCNWLSMHKEIQTVTIHEGVKICLQKNGL